MSEHSRPLVGSVFERKRGSSTSAPFSPKAIGSSTGFPAAQHRSKSVFSRNRGTQQQPATLSSQAAVPSVVQLAPKTQELVPPKEPEPDTDDWRIRMSEENERRVAAMTEEEREQERREIEEKFGKNIADVLRRARLAREAHQKQKNGVASSEGDTSKRIAPPSVPPVRTALTGEPPLRPPSPSPILSSASTRPSTPVRANRKLRFADVTAADVHVYESAPPSPRRKPLALPPPSGDDLAVSLGQWKGPSPCSIKSANASEPQLGVVAPNASAASSSIASNGPPEKGTPEDIRRRFFPWHPTGDPSLAWIESTPLPDPTAPTLRFDLHGAPIPPELSATLPTHLGLHHHAEGAQAGYTLDDIFLLTRSTVPAQRAVMLGVVAGIVRRLASIRRGTSSDASGMETLRGKEEDVRKRAVAAGAEAMAERGSIGSRAVEVLWEALVRWDEELMSSDGIELQDDPPGEVPMDKGGEGSPKGDAISSLQLRLFLPQMVTIFGAADLPHLALVQLLAVLQRLAMHNNAVADEITATPSLIANVLRVFVLTPIPPSNSPPPDPAAIHLLTTLASASRVSASRLLDPADALLRFLTSTPISSPYPLPLATDLLIKTLNLYTTFARYGMYAHIATTGAEPFARLTTYIIAPECDSRPLLTSYVSLLAAWIICASDPHQTTPPHDILWSQVSGWGWISDLTTVAHKLTRDPSDWGTWAALWNVEAAWFEGARHNCVRGGAGEREILIARLRPAFDGGIEKEVVLGAISSLKRLLSEIPTGYDASRGLAFYREMVESVLVLSAAIRLWLACLPLDYEPLPEPPFQLPFSLLGTMALLVATHPLLSELSNIPSRYRPFLRPLVSFITNYFWLSRRLPGTTRGLWLAQLAVAIMRSLPGDEDAARGMLEALINLVDEQCLLGFGWSVPSDVWSRGGLRILTPFLVYDLVPRVEGGEEQGEETLHVRVAPLFPTPHSLRFATTQRLPSTSIRNFTFLFSRDWPVLPLDHLLHSGTSSVWQHLPSDWDASETDVVRATLILTRIVREAVVANGTPAIAMNRAEVTFSCMKVFMLEHGQAQGAPSASGEGREEVFRDGVVGELMEALLLPHTLGTSTDGLSAIVATDKQDNLELAAARFLGAGTPFFQFYTDFVTLYDATSFGHPLFAALLLPPLAQSYASDYRKLLYDDTAHVLGTVRTPAERVIGNSASAFLWPAEQVPQIVGAQLSLLLGRRARVPIEGFVRWMAVHHVAANIWPDLREDPSNVVTDERGRKLFEALVNQGEHRAVRDVCLYWQRRTGRIVTPPVCFDQDPEPERRRSRLTWVQGWAKGGLLERVEGLFGVKDPMYQ